MCATIFKSFTDNDIANTRTLLHEAIPITGSIVSGTYSDNNIKNYSHGMFQSVYDYPYLSSSANHIFDITVGYSANSSLSSSLSVQNARKINIYNQMAQVLVGHDLTGSILEFDEDGDIIAGGTKLKECIFVSYARLLHKDEIKRGSYTMSFNNVAAYSNPQVATTQVVFDDADSINDYRTNSPAGEYGIIRNVANDAKGLIYYQAGMAVLTASVFSGLEMNVATEDIDTLLTDYEISSSANAIRHRWYDNDFNNTIELNSTIYFCRMNHNEFNYSSNPTYLSESKIRVKDVSADEPIAYCTTIGLMSSDNEMLAVAKLSEPLKKTPSTELIIRTRIDW